MHFFNHHFLRDRSAFLACALIIVLVIATNAASQIRADASTKMAPPPTESITNAFYQTSDPVIPGRPGELIRSQPWDGYMLPYGVSAVRILYHSVSARGEDVPASGVVLFPTGPVPAGGWPIIAWAHSFTGAARFCAPSLMKSLYGAAFLSMYVKLGFTIIAPDYVGLGTASRNAALDAQSNAVDLIYSISAAQAALPQVGKKWVAAGERDGGLTALIVAEKESDVIDSEYLGSIAIAPILDLKAEIESSKTQNFVAFMAYGLKTLHPDFEAHRILSPLSISDYEGASKSCSLELKQAVSFADLARPGWDDNPFVTEFLEKNALGFANATKPALIIITTDPGLTVNEKQSLGRMCTRKDKIDLEQYDVSVDDLAGESVTSQIAWVRARLSGLTVPSLCQKWLASLK
jgi:hypothetical protein